MQKAIFFKKGLTGILIVWFFLCILSGDCFLLGCGEKGLSHCTEKETVVVSCTNTNTNSSIPVGDTHCPNCCVLCAHNLVMDVFQAPSYQISTPSSLFKVYHNNHVKNILQTVIYHPPRLLLNSCHKLQIS